jgi:hypothetical protein
MDLHFPVVPMLHPNAAKAGGLQSQGAKGEAVVWLLRALGIYRKVRK